MKQYLRIFGLFLCILGLNSLFAQAPRFTLNKEKILEGEDFWLTIESQEQIQLPVFPDIPGAIKVKTISRPNEKGGLAFIQVYQAAQVGTLLVPSFRVNLEKKSVNSPPLSIKVKHKEQNLQSAYQATAFHPNLLLSLTPTACFVGEQIHIQAYLFVPTEERDNYVLESRALSRFQKQLHLNGFWVEENEVEVMTEKDTILNGKMGTIKLLFDAFEFPKAEKDLLIDNISLQVLHKYILPFGANSKDLNEKNSELRVNSLKLTPLKIKVNALPTTSLLNAQSVGDFTITSELSDRRPFTGDALTLKVNIEGAGNIAHLPKPILQMPPSFFSDEPSVRTTLHKSQELLSGNKQLIYEFYPTQAGDFDLGQIVLYYFSTTKKRYDSISIPLSSVHVRGEDKTQEVQMSNRELFYKAALNSTDKATIIPDFIVIALQVLLSIFTGILALGLWIKMKP